MFSPEIEKADRKTIREMQLERLKHIVAYAYERVPMYKERFDAIGLRPEHIKTLKDIEHIPYTTKDDLRDNYPFKLFAVPMKQIIRLHASSGTTGKPVVCGYTRKDLDNWSTCIARILTMAGATDEDIFHVAFGYGLFTGGFGLHYGVEKLGATVVPVSSGNTERQIMLLKDFTRCTSRRQRKRWAFSKTSNCASSAWAPRLRRRKCTRPCSRSSARSRPRITG